MENAEDRPALIARLRREAAALREEANQLESETEVRGMLGLIPAEPHHEGTVGE